VTVVTGFWWLIPWLAPRCYLCPFGATFGLLNHAGGFYGIEMDTEWCIDCQRCEQACDMAIPVWQQGKATGQVTGIEDCMGCARCIISCPTDALAIHDVRNLLRPNLRQDMPPGPALRRSLHPRANGGGSHHRHGGTHLGGTCPGFGMAPDPTEAAERSQGRRHRCRTCRIELR